MALKVLISTDGSDPSRRGEEVAVRLARKLDCELTLAHAVELGRIEHKMIPDFQIEMIQERADQTAKLLLKREEEFFATKSVNVIPRLLEGSAPVELSRVMGEAEYDMALLGSRGNGDLHDLIFGSVSSHMVHHCMKPLLIAKSKGPDLSAKKDDEPIRVLVALDGSGIVVRGLEFLAGLDNPSAFDVTLMHVVDIAGVDSAGLPPKKRYEVLVSMHEKGEALLEERAKPLRKAGFSVVTRVEEGHPGRTICRVYQEDEFEIALMGRRKSSELGDFLYGTVDHHVLHSCPGHLLIVPNTH